MTRPTVTLANVDYTDYLQDRSLSVKTKSADITLIDPPTLANVGSSATITDPTWAGFITGREQVLYRSGGVDHLWVTYRCQNNAVLADAGPAPFDLVEGSPSNYKDFTVSEVNTDGKLEVRAKCVTRTAGMAAGMGVAVTNAINGYTAEPFTIMDVTTTWPTADDPEYALDLGLGDFATASTGASGPGGTDKPLTPHTLGDEIDRRCCHPGSSPYIPSDTYPACGATSWPYEGTVVGLSDKIGLAGGAPVDTGGWACFTTGETYHYEITGHATNPHPGAWSVGLAGAAGDASAAPNVFVLNPTSPFDTPDISETGTFVCGAGLSLPGTVWFYSSVADQFHANASVTVHYKFWPDGSPTTTTPEVGQADHEEFTSDGTTPAFQVGYPYAPGTPDVTVDGVHVTPTETDPTTGDITLPLTPPNGSKVQVHYVVDSTTPTGGGGTYPAAGYSAITYPLLGTGGDGSGDNVLHDDGTWGPESGGGDTESFSHGSMGATETFDPADGTVHDGTLTADCTVTLTAPVNDYASLELWLDEDGTGGWDVIWPGSVIETGTHDTSPSTTQRVILETIDGGTNWIATWIGGNAAVGALDDLSDVTITSPAAGDRLRYSGSEWVNSALIWRPVMVQDPSSGNWFPVVTGDGDAVLVEA